jgi:hypothetical protein
MIQVLLLPFENITPDRHSPALYLQLARFFDIIGKESTIGGTLVGRCQKDQHFSAELKRKRVLVDNLDYAVQKLQENR